MASPKTDRNRWVKVAPRDVPDCVGHGHHCQAQGERHAQQTYAHPKEFSSDDGASAASEHEPERADEFRNKIPDHFRPRSFARTEYGASSVPGIGLLHGAAGDAAPHEFPEDERVHDRCVV